MNKIGVIMLGLTGICSEGQWIGEASASTLASSIAVSAIVEAICQVAAVSEQNHAFTVKCSSDVPYSISRSRAGVAAAGATSDMAGAAASDTLLSRALVGSSESRTSFVMTTVTY